MLWEYVNIGSDVVRSTIAGVCLVVGLSLTASTKESRGKTCLGVAERVRNLRRQRTTKSGSPKKNDEHKGSMTLEKSKGLGLLLALEPRIMFDGAAFLTGAEVVHDQVTQDLVPVDQEIHAEPKTFADPFTTSLDLLSALSAVSAPSDRKEIVFIDTRVKDYQTLMEGIEPQAEVILLDSTRDGIEQIAESLHGRSNIDGLHLIAEGNAAELHLGTTFLTKDAISGQYANLFTQIGQSLSASADLLIYGCNFGEGQAGLDAMDTLAKLTGADIAASTDRTGHVSEFANWELEASTGFIETSIAVSEATQAAWEGALATYTVTTTTDGGAGSLRQAILDANANSGTDTITFVGSGTYLLTITGAGEDAAATGDLDITEDLILIGNGAGNTVIDASGFGGTPDRVFQIKGTNITATMSGITIQGGDQTNSGGIFVDNTTTLNLSDATLTGNHITAGTGANGTGGAIHVHGTANLTDVLLSGNTANIGGGGISFHNTGTGSLTNVTISGNSTAGNGGGIWNDSNITVTNSTISGNSANLGGGIYNEGTIDISNTTVSGNMADTGAGIYNDMLATDLTLTNVTVSGNIATSAGGGLWTQQSATIVNSTFTLNSADAGGGIRTQGGSGTVDLLNTIVAGNTAGSANPDLQGTFTTSGFNLIGDGTGQSNLVDGVNNDQVGSGGSPINPLLGGLADNGGPTLTHALLASSLAIDAGTATGAPTVDQRGITRSSTPDIGAYESLAIASTAEFTVNDPSGNNEETIGLIRGAERAVAIAPNGDYVVVWTDTTGSDRVFAKVLDANGNEKVAQFQVDLTGGASDNAGVAMDDNGNFVVTWTQGNDILMRRFQADGTAVDLADVTVNTISSNQQVNPSVAMNGGGDFVIAWEGTGGVNEGIFLRQGSFAGGLIGSDITVDTLVASQDPSVDINDNGKFVVVWQKGNEPYAQRFAANGTPRGSAIDINPFASSLEQHAVVAVQSSGDFVVAYRSEVVGFEGVWMKRYRDDGTAYALATKVSSGTSHVAPSIDMDSFGNYTIVYDGDGDGSGKGVFGRSYNSGGAAQGAQFQINQATLNAQDRASVAMLDPNNFVVVWTGSDGAQTDVFARQFGATVGNTAPVNTVPAATTVAEDTALAMTGGNLISVTDVDGNLASTQLTVLNGTVTVTLSGAATISAGTNGTNTLTISGTETDINATLASLLYQGTLNYNGADTLTTVSTDSAGTPLSDTDVTNITVTAVNDQPSFAGLDNAPTFIEGGAAVVLDNNATIADPELDAANNYNGATLTLGRNGGANGNDVFNGSGTLSTLTESGSLVVGGTTIGTVTTNSAGTLVLTFNGNATTARVNSVLQQITYRNTNGTPPPSVQIDFTINDGNAGGQGSGPALIDTGSITVTITPVNTPPVNTVPATATVAEDTALAMTGPNLISVTDVDGNLASTQLTVTQGTFTVTLSGAATISAGGNGTNTLTLSGTETDINASLASLVYQGTLNYNGADTLTTVSTDSAGTPLSDTDVTNITVTSVNDQPSFTGLDNTPTFTEGGAAVVLDNNATIADPELDAANNYNGATLTLARNGGANAEDLFDGSGTLNTLTESGTLVVGGTTIGTVTTNSGGTLVLTFNGNATTARVNSALQQITYRNTNVSPPANVQVDYTFNDGNAGAQGSGGALNATGSITVTINSSNIPPVAVADGFSVNNGATSILDLAGNDSDVDDGLDLTSITIVSGPTNGTIDSINVDGTVTYTHNGSATITDSFTYTINDLAAATSNVVTVSLNVVNVAPVAVADGFTVNEGSTNNLNLAGNDTDPDDGLDLTSITIVSGPTNGTIDAINANGTVEYTHNGSETLSDSFTYTINDVGGNTSNTVTVSLIITPQNDPPSITSNGGGATAAITVIEGNTAVTDVNATDGENTPLTYNIIGGADAALFTIDPTTGVLTFITAPNLATPSDVGGDNVYDVVVQASDGTAADTQAIAVTVTNAPVIVLPPPPDPAPESSPPSDEGDGDAGESEDEALGGGLGIGAHSTGGVSTGSQSATEKDSKDSDGLHNLTDHDLAAIQQLRENTGMVETASNLLDALAQSFNGVTVKSEIQSLLDSSGFLRDLDQVRDAFDGATASEKTYMASSIAASTGLSIGYVFWLLRSGVLLTALLSTVPAWQFVNPLLVLDTPSKHKLKINPDEPEDDSVEAMFNQPSQTTEPSANPTPVTHRPRLSRWFRRTTP